MADVVSTTAPEAAAPAAPAPVVTGKSGMAVLKDIRAERAKRTSTVPKADDEAPEAPALEADEPTQPDLETTETETADEEPPVDKQPTWAQKLRTDLGKKTERVQHLERQHAEREQRFAEAHTAVQHKIEDATADLDAERAYSTALEQSLAKQGFRVPADWKRAFAAEHRAKTLERQLARGSAVENARGSVQAGEAAKNEVRALGKKFPEMDFAKDADGKAWLAARFGEGGKGLKDLEADALTFVKALRYDRSQKATKRPAQSEQQPRPSSTTLAGSTANAGQKRTAHVPQNEKESIAFLAARKAARA